MNELVTNNVFMQEKTDIKEDEAQLRLQEAQDIIDNANKQENNTNNIQTQQIIQQENKTAQNLISNQINNNIVNNQERLHNNKIDEKVKQYIEKNKVNFSSNIDIETKIINEKNAHNLNYKLQSQGVIYSKAKELFSNIHRRVFKNNNQNIYVTNADIKESIEKTLKNASQKAYLNENIAVFSKLDKIIENAELISSEKFDNKGRNQYENYEYYVSKVKIDEEPYIVEFDTRLQEGTSGKKRKTF